MDAINRDPTHISDGRDKSRPYKGDKDMINGLIAPHGGELILNMASEQEQDELRARAKGLPQVEIGSRQLADLEMLAIGAYSPLGGFMTRADYLGSVNDMHLSNGLPWSVPITLSVSTEQASALKEGSQIALVVQGALQAVMTHEEKVGYDKEMEAGKGYPTTNDSHPPAKVSYPPGGVPLGG